MAKRDKSDIEHAIKWLATEYEFLEKLHQDLEKINQSDLDDQAKELKRDQTYLRYVGNATGRVDRDIKQILSDLKKGNKIDIAPEKLDRIFKSIEIPSKTLVQNGSRYVGNLRSQLRTVRTDVALEKKYSDEKHRKKVQAEINKLNTEVKELEEWVAALVLALKRTKPLILGMSRRGFLKRVGAAATFTAAGGLAGKARAKAKKNSIIVINGNIGTWGNTQASHTWFHKCCLAADNFFNLAYLGMTNMSRLFLADDKGGILFMTPGIRVTSRNFQDEVEQAEDYLKEQIGDSPGKIIILSYPMGGKRSLGHGGAEFPTVSKYPNFTRYMIILEPGVYDEKDYTMETIINEASQEWLDLKDKRLFMVGMNEVEIKEKIDLIMSL